MTDQSWAFRNSLSAPHFLSREVDRLDKHVDIIASRVDAKAGPSRGRNTEQRMQGHRAVMAVTDGNSLAIDQVRQILRMKALDGKADNGPFLRRLGPEDLQARHH